MCIKLKIKNSKDRRNRNKGLEKRLISIYIVMFACYLCSSCNNTYESQFTKCLESVEVSEFTISGSEKKGYGYKNANPTCLLGAPLPEFKTIDLDDNIISTQNIKGKINVINFWFIKCRPCVAEIPDLNTLTKKYNNDKFNFLAITLDSPDLLKPFLEKHPFQFNIIPNGKELFNDKFHIIYGYPFTIITDKRNKIIGALSADTPETTLANIESILADVK